MEKPSQNPSGVTSPDIFKKLAEERKGTLVELPSGITVKLGKPFMSDLLAAGDIPGELINAALGEEVEGLSSQESAARSAKLMAHIVSRAVIEPKVLLEGEPDYDAGQISIQDLSDTDRTYIYAHVQEGVVNRLKKFRNDTTSEAAGSDMQKISGDKAKPAPKSSK